jgi:hypothetical protein
MYYTLKFPPVLIYVHYVQESVSFYSILFRKLNYISHNVKISLSDVSIPCEINSRYSLRYFL